MLDRLEHQLAEAQALAHIGSWEWDLLTGRLSWSDEHYRIFGLDPGTPIAFPGTLQYVHPDEQAYLKQLSDRALIDHQPYTCQFRVPLRDGAVRIVEAHARVDVDSSGQAVRMYGTAQDITERRRAEHLLDLRARQQAAVARLGETALSRTDLPSLLDCAVSLVAETLDVEFCRVLETGPDGDLVVRSAIGWGPDLIGATVPRGQDSQAGDVTVVIGPPPRPYGVLAAHTGAPRRFSVDDVNFLQGIASILAAAIVRRRGDDVRDHLLARAISAQEEERGRVARELHDETGQALSAILLGLKNLEHTGTVDRAQAQARRLRELTAQTVRDVGRLARGLRPSTLDDLGLFPALQRYGEELGASHDLDVCITGDEGARFPANVETTLYRIVQEALTNVARHARAGSAEVVIQNAKGLVQVTVRDDGAGFDVNSELQAVGSRRGRGLGLMGMHERASLLGGSLVISSRPGEGTSITVELPVNGAP